MTAKTGADPKPIISSTDGGFKLAVVISTALFFAAMFGWLACLDRTESGGVDFRWHWRALAWAGIGIASTVYFWRQAWPARTDATAGQQRARLVKGWAALLVPSLIWMTYPLRFISGQRLFDVFFGLALAAAVLASGGWMVFRLIKAFNEDGPVEEKPEAGAPPEK